MAMTIQEGALSIPAGQLGAARTLGASRAQLILHIYLAASLPFITTALRVGFSQAWRALVAAEMIGASQGIGWMVAIGGQTGNTAEVCLASS
jgi:taurine transport system permease protein